MKIRVSEIFTSFQGEGRFTGLPTIFVRFFGCNLKCDGFGQAFPDRPETYILPYKEVNPENYKSLNDLPVFSMGCDSSYSWDPRFKCLIEDSDEVEVGKEIMRQMKEELHIDRGWEHEKTGNVAQLCFTGGEPMLYQKQMLSITNELAMKDHGPQLITIETNATKPLKELKHNVHRLGPDVHFSCSPKLFNVSGEKDAIKPEVIAEYVEFADHGVLKFVHNGSKAAWDELDNHMEMLYPIIIEGFWTVFIMPVGATVNQQQPDKIEKIVREALSRGYQISLRAHTYAFGNKIGT